MKLIYYALLSILFVACKVSEKPEYKALENITINEVNGKTITVAAEAVYYNPNHIGGSVKKVDIDLFMDGVKLSKVKASAFEINSQENFRIPLKAEVPHSKLFGSSGKQFLGNLLNAALNKSVKINYKGVITLDLGAVEYDYHLDETMELDLH